MRRVLGRMEEAQASTNRHFPFNAVVSLHLSDGPPAEILPEVLGCLQRRHPLLGVHVDKEKGRYLFVSEGTPPIPLEVVERRDNEHWRQAVEEELNCGFDISRGPPVRFTYLIGPGPKKPGELIITFQHAVMDAVSTAHLLDEILSLWREVESRGSIEKCEPMAPLPSAEMLFPPPFKGPRRKWKTFRFGLRQMGDEFLYRLRSRGRRKPPIHEAGRCKILTMTLEAEIAAALGKHSRKKKVTLNSLFAAAMLMAVHKHLYDGAAIPLRHIGTADLRPYLIPPPHGQYLGSYFAMMRFTVGMKEKPGIWELAREINDTAYSSLKKGDKFCALLMSARMMRALFRFKSFRMAATALSLTGPVDLEPGDGKIKVRDIHAFISNFVLGPEYTAQVKPFGDRLNWDILYLDSDMGHDRAQAIAEEIRTLLESAVGAKKG